MKWTEIPAGELHAAEQRLRVALGDKAGDIVKEINKDQGFTEVIAGEIIQKVIKNRIENLHREIDPNWEHNWERAKGIMGKNFFGIEESIKYFWLSPTLQQLNVFSKIPFSEAKLNESKDTHILIAVFPLSILDIRGEVEHNLFSSHENAWYNKQSFAEERGEISWQLVRRTPVENSTDKKWIDQQALLGKDDEVPSARVMVYTIIGHYLATGERLFGNIYVRTSSVVSGGSYVNVGYFGSKGLYFDGYWCDYPHDSVGVSSARKIS